MYKSCILYTSSPASCHKVIGWTSKVAFTLKQMKFWDINVCALSTANSYIVLIVS